MSEKKKERKKGSFSDIITPNRANNEGRLDLNFSFYEDFTLSLMIMLFSVSSDTLVLPSSL